MRLQPKVSLSIALVFTVFGIVVLVLFNTLLLGEFTKIEELQTKKNVIRIIEAFQNEVESLIERTRDWAVWDDAYRFVDDHYPEFIESNMTYNAVKSIAFDHIIFLDRKLNLSYAIEVDFEQELVKEISDEIKNKLIDTRVFENVFTKGEASGGVLSLKQGNFLVAAYPIFDSANEKPQRGVLIFTRKLTDETQQRLSNQTKLPIQFISKKESHEKVGSNKLITIQEAFSEPTVEIFGEEIQGETQLYDIYGQLLASFKFTLPRSVYLQGLEMRKFLGLAFLGMASITALLVIALIDRLVVSRIFAMNTQLGTIAQGTVFSGRLQYHGSDEVAGLAGRMNQALEALDKSNVALADACQRADQANSAKSQFLAKVSHEIRTPLHSIMGMLRIIYRGEQDDSRRNYIGLVRNSAHTLLTIINDLLDFSKAESGMLQVEMKELVLQPILEAAIKAVAAKVYESGKVELLFDIDADVPQKIVTDNHRLQQVLINLLGNSTKFTEKGAITLLTSFDQRLQQIRIDIRDTGFGIPTEILPRIFDPFVQVEEKRHRSKGGTGLGLTITKQLVETLGGSIHVTSEIGKGSEFSIFLPVGLEKIETRTSSTSLKDELVCIASNSEELNNFLAESMRKIGAECIFYSGIEEAISQQNLALYIVIDDTLLSEIESLEMVRQASEDLKKKLYILVNPLNLNLHQELTASGVIQILWKPISASQLFEKQADPLDQSRYDNDSGLKTNVEIPKLNIIIADDMPTNTIILGELLRDAGHTVTTVENGQLLVEALGIGDDINPQQSFDIVFTDLQMPVLDGLGAIKVIRGQSDEIKSIPVVVVTADGYEESHRSLVTAGADAVMVKPFNIEKLDGILQNLLHEARIRSI
jgi:signal transduction histidine kinase/DNA-binding response OmpR family regulator